MTLHHLILKNFVESGFPPTLKDLVTATSLPEEKIQAMLSELEAAHGVLLHLNSHKVWVAHPFAAAPTGWWVEQDGRGWFSNCIWCSLGVCALVGGESHIHTCLGGESEKTVITVTPDGPVQKNYVAHFSVPMQNAWDNVLFTCATMHLFRDEDHVHDWCQRHNLAKGEVVPIRQVWGLARVWYGKHLDKDWKKWTVKEAGEIFTSAGLTSDFWKLKESGTEENF